VVGSGKFGKVWKGKFENRFLFSDCFQGTLSNVLVLRGVFVWKLKRENRREIENKRKEERDCISGSFLFFLSFKYFKDKKKEHKNLDKREVQGEGKIP